MKKFLALLILIPMLLSVSTDDRIQALELETLTAFQTYLSTKTYDQIDRSLDKDNQTNELQFYSNGSLVFLLKIENIFGDWSAFVSTLPIYTEGEVSILTEGSDMITLE